MIFMKRNSGVLMHISSLWGEYSEGSLGKEAFEWLDFLAECGFHYWQVLPFCLPDDCNSPYKSTGAFSVNPYFIDLPTLQTEGLLTEAELRAAKQTVPYACEFDRLNTERMQLLALAASRVRDRAPALSFMEQHPQLDQFCRFMALKDANGNAEWDQWTTDICDPEVLWTWQFTQYEFCRQWKAVKAYANSKGISIIGDIPIYVAYDSSDVWANKDLFQLNQDGHPSCVAGVPPDYFCPDGQLWGNPLYDWKRMKQDGYAWWRQRMAFMMELFDGVRIDHFRGLESYYSIPAKDTTAKNGKWVKGPGLPLIRALKEVCGDRLLIAEDLGDITPAVRRLVDASGCPGMRVLQFGFLGDENSPHLPHNYDNNCVAYTGTHDNNTLLGYVWDLDDKTRARLMRYCGYTGDWNSCYNAILRTMFASHAGLLILPVQDLLLFGKDTRINTPGQSVGNWSYRITKEQLKAIPISKFADWNILYGR